MKHAALLAALGVYIMRVRGDWIQVPRIDPDPSEPEPEHPPALLLDEEDS